MKARVVMMFEPAGAHEAQELYARVRVELAVVAAPISLLLIIERRWSGLCAFCSSCCSGTRSWLRSPPSQGVGVRLACEG